MDWKTWLNNQFNSHRAENMRLTEQTGGERKARQRKKRAIFER